MFRLVRICMKSGEKWGLGLSPHSESVRVSGLRVYSIFFIILGRQPAQYVARKATFLQGRYGIIESRTGEQGIPRRHSMKNLKEELKMMKNNITELVFLLDRSGSMASLVSDTIGGFNGMIAQQKKEQEGDAFVTTILFDDTSKMLHDRLPLADVPPMTESDYQVRGYTALLDAVGGAIEHIEKIHKYAREEDVPAHTMFVITTDGLENASRKFSYQDIKRMISRQKERGWEFVFIGANIDAPEFAEQIGVGRERSATYCADSRGTSTVFSALSAPIRAMRAGKKIDKAWAEAACEIDSDRKNRP